MRLLNIYISALILMSSCSKNSKFDDIEGVEKINFVLNKKKTHGVAIKLINDYDVVIVRKNFSKEPQAIYPLAAVTNKIVVRDKNDSFAYQFFSPNVYLISLDTILPNEVHKDTFDVYRPLMHNAREAKYKVSFVDTHFNLVSDTLEFSFEKKLYPRQSYYNANPIQLIIIDSSFDNFKVKIKNTLDYEFNLDFINFNGTYLDDQLNFYDLNRTQEKPFSTMLRRKYLLPSEEAIVQFNLCEWFDAKDKNINQAFLFIGLSISSPFVKIISNVKECSN